MKTIVCFLFLFSLMFGSAIGQKITFSAKEFDKDVRLAPIGKTNESVYFFSYTAIGVQPSGAYDIEQFDFNLASQKEFKWNDFHDPGKKQRYLGLPILFNDKLTFIKATGSLLDSWDLNISQPFEKGESEIIGTIHHRNFAFDVAGAYLLASDNNKYLVASSTFFDYKLKQDEFEPYFYLVDQNLKPVITNIEFKPSDDTEEHQTKCIKGLYNNYLITSDPYGTYDIINKEFSKFDKFPSVEGFDFEFHFNHFDSLTNYITFHNLYKSYGTVFKNEAPKGWFSYTFDLQNRKVVDLKNMPFSEKDINELLKIKTDRGSEYQKVFRAIQTKDGEWTYVIESYSLSPDNIFKKMNIYFVSIQKDGQIKWMRKIERKDKISRKAGRADWGSFALLKTKDDIIHVFFNDDSKVFEYSVDNSGTIKPLVLIESEQGSKEAEEVIIYPKHAINVSESEIIIPCYKFKDGTVRLMKISY